MVNAYFEGAAHLEVGTEDAAVLFVANEPGSFMGTISAIEYTDPGVGKLTFGPDRFPWRTCGDGGQFNYGQSRHGCIRKRHYGQHWGRDGCRRLPMNTATLVAAAINSDIDASALVAAEGGGDTGVVEAKS